jgi:aspartate kinase
MTDSPGTLVTGGRLSPELQFDYEQKPVAAIARIDNKALIRIEPLADKYDSVSDEELFFRLSEEGINISMINLHSWRKAFVTDNKHADMVASLLVVKPVNLEILRNCSILTVIGSGMKGIPGVMAAITHAFAKENIPLLHTSDSHTTISCLVESKYEKAALNALHGEFKL